MDSVTTTDRFYAGLPALDRFERFAAPDAYVPAPDDWVVLAGDVRGSTAAIAAGRYKDVNMVGAAVISAVLNACPGPDLPYVFGGDGGAVAVPPALAPAGAGALRRLQAHAGRAFGLEMRAAAVPVARLRAEGHPLLIGRLRLNASNHLAMFSGGGVEHAERILKGPPDDPAILHPDPDEAPPDLQGLSCRWEPLAASRGRMIALMVRPAHGDPDGWPAILSGLTGILQSLPAHAPATADNLRLRWPPRGILLEARAAGRGLAQARSLARTAVVSALQKWAHWYGRRVGPYDPNRYIEEVRALTDFRRFDDCLRVVLDCSPGEVAAIDAWLDAEHRAGRLAYGLHEDRAALMTCLVFSVERAEHVHFVDAAGGGFARAAEDFKRRLRSLPGTSPETI